MKKKIIFVILAICLLSCKENYSKAFYELLNDNFLSFVDTLAYKTGRLIQIPNDSINISNETGLGIIVDTSISMDAESYESILTALRNEGLKEFEALLLKGADTNFSELEVGQISKKGKYNLVVGDKVNDNKNIKIVGKLKFYIPFISKNKAIITCTVSEQPKAGYTDTYLFEEENGKWKKIRVIEIERW